MIRLNITLIFTLLYLNTMFAQVMTVESVTTQQSQIPVLKGNEMNPVIQIRINTTGKTKPLSLREVSLQVSGTDIKNDIGELEIYYTETKPFLRDGIRFGVPEKPNDNISVSGHQKLVEGENIFWVSFKLKKQANILNQVNAICSSVTISGQKFTPEQISKVEALDLGIALRKHMDEGVHTYRIPGLETTNNGTLIAVYDIRKNSSTDLQEDIDIGMSRSTDGGNSWEPMKIIMDMDEWGGKPNIENGIGDPSILIDRQTNTIWVAALWAHGHPGQRTWLASKPGEITPQNTGQLMLVKSEDDGVSWSDPINITSQIKRPEWHLLLQGPGKGITMSNGTLVFPAQFKDENQVPYSTIIWSKDHGKTWQSGTGAKSETTEAQVIELINGNLMLNMRDNRNREDKTETNGRSVYITGDLGQTWVEHPTSNKSLPEPTCMASLIKEEFEIDGKQRDVVFFSNPNSKYHRDHMTVKTSFDDGNTWPTEYYFLLDEQIGNGYSCLTKIDEKHIGILYEGSQADLTFQIVPIEKIMKQNTSLTYIFKSGTEGYSTFRIPAIVTTNSGRILAFAEGRVNSSSDTGDIDLVMRSSEDGGKTWSPLKIIWNDGNNVCGNPAPVVDRETGDIHLLMTWNLGKDHERDIIELKSKDTRRVFISSSKDEGKNWSDPEEITPSTKKENWTWYATGPCHGIQLKYGQHKGRLVIPCDHIEANTKKYFSHIIYSDDNGKTWELGGTTPQDQVNECTVAELPDGRLILNMRNYDRFQKTRKISYSEDGGISWSDVQSRTDLIEPICQASSLFAEENQILYFSNPANENRRTNMTLKSSKDLGRTWISEKVIYSGASAYSDLSQINEKTLGCLYEGGKFSPYEGIVFTTTPIINSVE